MKRKNKTKQESMLGYVAGFFAAHHTPVAIRNDLKVYNQAVQMLESGRISADMFVMISFGVMTKIRNHPQCRMLMQEYVLAMGE